MADWWNNIQTGFGDALIGVNNPFGLAPPEGFDRNAAMRQGALSLGLNVLANADQNPAVALGRGYRQAQALASDNQQNALAAQAMMSAAEEKKRKREEEEQAKKELDAFISTLPREQQGLARLFPEKFGAQMVEQQFPDQQGYDAPKFGLAPVALADKNGKFVGWGQMSNEGGLYFNGQQVDGSGDVVPMAPFDSNQMKAAGTAAGKEMGGAAAAIPGAEIDTQAMNDRIDMIRDNPNLGSAIGYGNALGDYFVGNDVLAIRSQLNELEGGAFLSAYSSLKGGGQITEIESAQAKQAMADMQTARKMSDVDKFKEALERFRGAVNRGMEKIRRQAGQYAPGGSPAAGGDEQWIIGPDGKPKKVQ